MPRKTTPIYNSLEFLHESQQLALLNSINQETKGQDCFSPQELNALQFNWTGIGKGGKKEYHKRKNR